MIDEDETREHRGGDAAGHPLHYDFAKFLTTLSLLALGGVLTLAQTANKLVAKPPLIGFVAGCVALAGVFAVSAAARVAEVATTAGRRQMSPRIMLKTAILFLGMGAGGFLVLWWKSIGG
ncbi:hypothetical protein GCM10022281_05410 [Sphingomonas rosea]|jgi:hypothetical protein|uniref:Transmembrane protein n=1 Tax=Sphingomonas rosea TaxID=335605 RepID=A0ABP7TP29_9SPHN